MSVSLVVSFVAGLLFSVGLALAGMTLPSKVVGFLDLFGNWDPSLAFVMGGAIAIYLPLYRLARARERPLLAARFLLPTRSDLDVRLLGGAAIFGIGWGLGGFCPGPSLAALGAGAPAAVTFVASMLVGMVLFRATLGRSAR